MSYALAYTTHFHSLDNTLWDINIFINGYNARPLEICLEGDEPCIIEWQETGKMDVVQSSTCTLRVSNENDRQMVQLMNHPDAACLVWREGKPYWWGHLDDAVYEEPYSFKKAYVTELTFSDFGILNRIPFSLTGKRSVNAIVSDCLEPMQYGDGVTMPVSLYTSLLDPNTQQPITLDMLYINADRFKSEDESWGDMISKREVLEEILRPLGLRIMQKHARIYIYDIEYLRDNDFMHNYIVWKGTDAYLKGSETFGWYEVAFEKDAKETVAEINLGPDGPVPDRVWAWYYDEDVEARGEGFYIGIHTHYFPNGTSAKVFKTRSGLSSSDDRGIAWRIKATKRTSPALIPTPIYYNDYVRWPVTPPSPSSGEAVASELFKIESGYLPLVPDRDNYQMRVNLDLLLSLLVNPAESDENWNVTTFGYSPITVNKYKNLWKKAMLRAYVPVKLELLDEQGNVLMHYRNTRNLNSYTHIPVAIGSGDWVAGPAIFSDMLLAYYNDGLETTPFEGWATNKQTMVTGEINAAKHLPSLYRNREQGEYVPMPPAAGILRLTVSNCIYSTPYPGCNPSTELLRWLNWQLYRNPKITLVKANCKDDGINTETVYERDMINLYADHLKETVKAGCWSEGIAPSARGLLFNANGIVWEKFIKNGKARTLEHHRLKSLEDQTFYAQPVLSGTAELNEGFCAYRDHSTSGIFIVTALRQDLHQDTEEVTMARIANEGGFVYEYEWSDPICVMEEAIQYNFAWGNPICAKEQEPEWSFVWGKPICVTVEKKIDN